MPDFLEGAEEELDEALDRLHPPKPGGLVDRHRRRRAEAEAEAERQRDAAEPVEEHGYQAVKVAVESPENFGAMSYSLLPSQTSQVLPAIPYRKAATLCASGAVLLARDSGAALGGTGFTLPAGIAIRVEGRGQLWCAVPASASGPVTVSVLSEYYTSAA